MQSEANFTAIFRSNFKNQIIQQDDIYHPSLIQRGFSPEGALINAGKKWNQRCVMGFDGNTAICSTHWDAGHFAFNSWWSGHRVHRPFLKKVPFIERGNFCGKDMRCNQSGSKGLLRAPSLYSCAPLSPSSSRHCVSARWLWAPRSASPRTTFVLLYQLKTF